LISILTLPAINDAQADFTDDLKYTVAFGIGSAKPIAPDGFKDGYDPSLGLLFDAGAAKSIVEVSVSFDYNFYLSNGIVANDINILNIFLNLKIKPLETTVRPYILVSGGYFRTWIVDLESGTENVLGYGGGAGIEVAISKTQNLFLEGKYIQGQTRKTERKANMEVIPIRFGVSWTLQ
jgi:hypothetical protein